MCIFLYIYLIHGSNDPTVVSEKPAIVIRETSVLDVSRNTEFQIVDDRKRSQWNINHPDLWKKNKTK